MIFKSKSPQQTQKIATNFAGKILKSSPWPYAKVFALEGELGAGKTTFIKGFFRSFGIKSHITSPTFVLLKSYKSQVRNFQLLVHIDAYRLKNYHDLIALGIKETIADPANIVLIEWSDRVKKILPKKYTKIHIDHIGKTTRKINILNFK